MKSCTINKREQNSRLLLNSGDVDSPHIQAAKLTRPLGAQPNWMLFKFTVEEAVWLHPTIGISSPVSKLNQSFMHQLMFLCLLEAQQSTAVHTQLGKYTFSMEAKASRDSNREAHLQTA